jgi:LPS-assembly protein
VTSTAGLYGRGRWWDAGLTVDHHQLADYTLNERSLPFDRCRVLCALGTALRQLA